MQLGNKLVDALLVLLGVEVDDECVYHDCGVVDEISFSIDGEQVIFNDLSVNLAGTI